MIYRLGRLSVMRKNKVTGLDISQQGDAVLFAPWSEDFNYVISVSLLDLSYTTILSREADKNVFFPQWSPDRQYIGYMNVVDGTNFSIEFLHIASQTVSEVPATPYVHSFAWSPVMGSPPLAQVLQPFQGAQGQTAQKSR